MLARLARGAGLATLVAVGFVAVPTIATATTPVVGHVYVNDNTTGTNTLGAFDQHSDGSLTPMAGSPFSAGGAGTGTIVGSQGSIQSTPDGNWVLAVDAGSNQISVLAVAPDGSLTPAAGSPVSSGGIEPVSIAVHGDLVYAANKGNGSTGSNYTGFTLSDDGRLTPLTNSTVSLPPTALPGDILFNGTGKNLIGIEVGTTDPSTFLIDSFRVGADGRLTAAAGSPFPAEAAGPFGSEFSPTDPHHLYVSNAHGGTGNGSVSAFSVNPNAKLKSITGSPFADNQTAPCWVEISHDGRYLFTVNTGSTTISSYRILANGTLALIGSTPFRGGVGIGPFDARLDTTGTHLYVVDAAAAAVSGFAVSGGSLSELASSPTPLPTGATPFGVAIVAA
ncbi:MAG TPA: beta-propeller fold lactonase family protein [Actinomycetota bacterium]|nr:beta-propeller fold lactonase family protein [Actinomycetota bacterium]